MEPAKTATGLPITLSVPAAAQAMGISPRRVWALIAEGSLRPVRLGSRTLLFREEIRDWLLDLRARQEQARPGNRSSAA